MELSNARVAVTGGTGFLGKHVVAALERVDALPIAVGRQDYDLRRRENIDRMLDEIRPDAVVHLAAVVGGIGANEASPGRFFYENAIMGIELVEACRVQGIEKILLAGTVCAYPKHTPVPFREDDLWNGYPEETNAPYGLAKKMLLVQAQAYRDEYGTNAIFVLPVNLYGPGDNFDLETGHVIPGMVRKFLDARDAELATVRLWGDGSPTREFLYVRDGAAGIRMALASYDQREPVNLGSGAEISIRHLAEIIRKAVGFRGGIEWDTSRPNGQPRRRLDTSRASEAFGFRAETTFEDGLRETIDWYMEHRSG
jgi:GDP-L-fucose synthase